MTNLGFASLIATSFLVARAQAEPAYEAKEKRSATPQRPSVLRFLSSRVLFGNDLGRIRHSSCFTGSRRRTNFDYWFLCSPAMLGGHAKLSQC